MSENHDQTPSQSDGRVRVQLPTESPYDDDEFIRVQSQRAQWFRFEADASVEQVNLTPHGAYEFWDHGDVFNEAGYWLGCFVRNGNPHDTGRAGVIPSEEILRDEQHSEHLQYQSQYAQSANEKLQELAREHRYSNGVGTPDAAATLGYLHALESLVHELWPSQ